VSPKVSHSIKSGPGLKTTVPKVVKIIRWWLQIRSWREIRDTQNIRLVSLGCNKKLGSECALFLDTIVLQRSAPQVVDYAGPVRVPVSSAYMVLRQAVVDPLGLFGK
jgi:hypothetical protein